MRRRTIAVTASIVLTVAAVAYAASFTVTTAHLATTTIAAPKLYPSSLATANKAITVGRAEKGDTLTVNYSEELLASSVCGGSTTIIGTQTLSGATVAINNNAAGNGDDTLTVTSVPTTSCTGGVVHFGTVDLGSASYVSTTVSFTSSTIALTQSSTSASVVITLGTASGTTATVTSGTAEIYTPDTAITDTAAHGIAGNTALTSATVQF